MFALYIRNCRSYRDFDNDFYRWFSLYFFLKMQHFEYQNYVVFYWPTSTVLLIIFCFSGSSINAKKKKKILWGVTHLLHMCVIFHFLTNDSLSFLFHLKSYFKPRDIQIFVFFSFPFLTFQIQKTSEYEMIYDVMSWLA